MRCKEIRDILLTDYADERLSQQQKHQLQSHLGQCAGCSEFQKKIVEDTLKPFREPQKLTPPESIWHDLRSAIKQEEADSYNPVEGFWQRLRAFPVLPKPAFALASLMAVTMIVVLVGLPIKRQAMLNQYLNDQASFISAETDTNGFNESFYDIGTGIEEYLL